MTIGKHAQPFSFTHVQDAIISTFGQRSAVSHHQQHRFPIGSTNILTN